MNFSNFKFSYIGSRQYGTNQYTFTDLLGSGRVSMNTQDDSPSTYMVKNNVTVEGSEFLKKYKNCILSLQDIEKYGYIKFFYKILKIESRALHKYYVVNEPDLKDKNIILRRTYPYSFD
ncbi:hypothetical protein R1T16_01630 [Flavobacterium sp. DG1-102-2]|nr:hypothetical protein [Flavobacterium sp. DG1-102-2]